MYQSIDLSGYLCKVDDKVPSASGARLLTGFRVIQSMLMSRNKWPFWWIIYRKSMPLQSLVPYRTDEWRRQNIERANRYTHGSACTPEKLAPKFCVWWYKLPSAISRFLQYLDNKNASCCDHQRRSLPTWHVLHWITSDKWYGRWVIWQVGDQVSNAHSPYMISGTTRQDLI